MPVIEAATVTLFSGLVGVAAWIDLTSLRIPNRLTAAMVLLFPAHLAATGTVADVLPAVAIASAVFVIGWVLFACRWIGGGDVKLAAAVALWAGPGLIGNFVIVTLLMGGGLALVMMMNTARFTVLQACDVLGARAVGDVLSGRSVPYGVAIAGAAILTVGIPLATR